MTFITTITTIIIQRVIICSKSVLITKNNFFILHFFLFIFHFKDVSDVFYLNNRYVFITIIILFHCFIAQSELHITTICIQGHHNNYIQYIIIVQKKSSYSKNTIKYNQAKTTVNRYRFQYLLQGLHETKIQGNRNYKSYYQNSLNKYYYYHEKHSEEKNKPITFNTYLQILDVFDNDKGTILNKRDVYFWSTLYVSIH